MAVFLVWCLDYFRIGLYRNFGSFCDFNRDIDRGDQMTVNRVYNVSKMRVLN